MSNFAEPKTHSAPSPQPPETPKVEQEILRALRGLSYGSVEIVVHEGRVVQIERKEKVRFN